MKLYRLTHPGDTFPCFRPPIYEKLNVTAGQESTYQELKIQESQYQEINPK